MSYVIWKFTFSLKVKLYIWSWSLFSYKYYIFKNYAFWKTREALYRFKKKLNTDPVFGRFLFPFFALYCLEIQLKKMKKHFQKTCVAFCTLFQGRTITRLMDFVCMDLVWVTTWLEGIKSLRSDLCKSNPNLNDTRNQALRAWF